MPVKINIVSTHELCTAVRPFFSDFSPNSYNRYQPDKAVWWLTPTKENPSYKYAKLCFMLDDRNEEVMLTGLYVEKGLGKNYCDIYGKGKLAMDNKWGWHRIVTLMQDGSIPKILQQIAAASSVKPLVMLSGQYSRPAFDPDAQRLKAETIYYEVDGAELKEVDYRPSPDKNPLGTLRKVSTMDALADRLQNLPESDFIWIDMAFVLPIEIDLASKESVTAEMIAKKFLSPFESMVAI